ncbi:Multifunctional methyltransferase subunit TRM112-like protein [Armadillidium nasatum]|uniref:Multifunctional methyltransferase subunit TRM112-like protein n=1 Tax=Armadillidium nasatum TaxID=96803 RepID=A0A5N5T2I2_9CRUS|nr:Multifunctional methyltransferase subunit TRM112-like protein [Armadillidium nasatum]
MKTLLQLSNIFHDRINTIKSIRNMKLITHNMLTSNALKTVKEGYPLQIYVDEVKQVDVDFQQQFITKTVSKLNWKALLFGAKCIGHSEGLPETLPENWESNDELLKKLHHVLLEIEVITGSLECPETKRRFPISNGIPNMLLNEDEV